MSQFDKQLVNNKFRELGYEANGNCFIQKFMDWERHIWIQPGRGHLAGSFTVNFDLIHAGILSLINPGMKLGNGNSVISIRIGNFLGVNDKWYSSLTPNCVQETTSELLTDVDRVMGKYTALNSSESIARCLWESGRIPMSLLVMSLYLDTEDIEKIASNTQIDKQFLSIALIIARQRSQPVPRSSHET